MTRALVLGGGLSALGVVRSLTRAGIASEIACSQNDPAALSSGVTKIHKLPASPSACHQLLESLSSDYVVIPCSDDWVENLSQTQAHGSMKARTLVPTLETVRTFTHKDRFAELLTELAVPHPSTIILNADDPNSPGYADLDSRYFLKPVDSQNFFRIFKQKAIRRDEPEANLLYQSAIAQGLTFLAQEYLPGEASKHYFIDGCCNSQGEIVAALARQRLRMYPPLFGNSTYMHSIPIAEVSQPLSHLSRLFRTTAFQGLFSAEWKLGADGTFRLLEVNIRAWWFVEFATRCGLNLPQLFFKLAVGEPTRVGSYSIGKHFFHPYYDLYALRELYQLPYLRWLYQLGSTWNSHFAWDDPRPAFASTIQAIWGHLR